MSAPPPDDSQASGDSAPGFGWNAYAERINGRFAMVGFAALVAIELWSGQGVLSWTGLR